MSYDRNPKARHRFFADSVLPPERNVLLWPSISWFVSPSDAFQPDAVDASGAAVRGAVEAVDRAVAPISQDTQ